MIQHSKTQRVPVWFDSGHASLCALGAYLRRIRFFRPLEEKVHIAQKALKYTAVQKLEMFVVSLLAGAKAVSHADWTVRVDPALCAAFGLPGCAEQSGIADTLNAATPTDVQALHEAVGAIFVQHSRARQHVFAREVLVLDIDLSPLPASAEAEGSERCYMGRCRSKTGRKLVRVRAAPYQETVWEEVLPGRTVETLAVVQQTVAQMEDLLGLAGDTPEARYRRSRTELRLDSGWGSTEIIDWLRARDYQVTGKFKSPSRVKKLVGPITPTAWADTSSAGRQVAPVPLPVSFTRPLAQYAVRTPSPDKPDGYSYAVLFTSRTEVAMQEVVTHYDARAGMEADLKSDKHGLGLAVIRKRRMAAQQMVVLLTGLAHNLLVWARGWLAAHAPRLQQMGIVRLVQEVWAIPGRVKLAGLQVCRTRLRHQHPCARDVYAGLRPLLAPGQTLAFWP
jgi:hypothetical protein